MEEAAKPANYLPIFFKSQKEQEYIAFLAYRMLTMSVVYFNIWQIKQTRPDDLEKRLVGFRS